MWKYIGKGYTPGVPARDLSDEEVAKIGTDKIIATGMYIKDEPIKRGESIMKQENTSTFDFGGCAQWIVENGVFVLGMFLMFARTVDIATAFAPNEFMGYENVEQWYGLAVGIMVEGALLVMKFTIGRPQNLFEWLWNVVLIIFPFAISALAQVFDSQMIRDTMSTQPETTQQFIAVFIPSIPTVIIGLFIGKAILHSIPPELAGKYATVGRALGENKPMQNIVGKAKDKLGKKVNFTKQKK